MIRLETASRYYLCCAQMDLFGGWEVWRAWGARGSGLGNSMRMPARDVLHARELLNGVLNERAARGYVIVAGTSGAAAGFIPGPP